MPLEKMLIICDSMTKRAFIPKLLLSTMVRGLRECIGEIVALEPLNCMAFVSGALFGGEAVRL